MSLTFQVIYYSLPVIYTCKYILPPLLLLPYVTTILTSTLPIPPLNLGKESGSRG